MAGRRILQAKRATLARPAVHGETPLPARFPRQPRGLRGPGRRSASDLLGLTGTVAIEIQEATVR
jgi:hypothetical protein